MNVTLRSTSSRSKRRIGATAVLTLSLGASGALPSCTVTRDEAACASTTECRSAFGPGFVCADDGLCAQAELEPSCQSQFPDDLLLDPGAHTGRVVFGSLLRASGKEGARHDAAELALEAVNRYLEDAGERYPQLADLRFGLVQCDHDGGTDEVARLGRYLTETLEVPVILGPASSSRTVAAFEEVGLADGDETRQALFISPSATSVALSELEEQTPGLLWRTAPMDDGQARLMGAYAVEQGMPLAAFYEDTAYGRGLYAELEMAASEVCDDCGISFEANSPDVVSLVRALASNEGQAALDRAELVLFMGAQETHIREMMKRLDDAEFEGKMLFLSDASASSDLVASVPASAIDRVLGTRASPPRDSEALRFFTSTYEAKHEESPLIHSFTANSYDAAWLAIIATLRSRLLDDETPAERIDPASIAAGLRRVSAEGWQDDLDGCPLDPVDDSCPELTLDVLGLDAIVDAFSRDEEVDVRGASGGLNYCKSDEELERQLDAFELWHLEETGEESPPYRIVTQPFTRPSSAPLPPCP